MTGRSGYCSVFCLVATVLLGSACQPARQAGPGPELQPSTGPAPLPAKAAVPLAELTPPIARPVDAADADKLPDRAVQAVQQGEAQLASGNHFQAAELFTRAQGFAPNAPRVQRGLGLAFAGLGDRAKAELNLRNSAARAPDHVRVQLLLGRYATLRGRTGQALGHFRTALLCSDAKDDSPDTAEAVLLLGGALETEGYWAAALECYEKLGRLVSTHGRAYASRPMLRLLLTQPERTMVARGRVLMRLRRPEEAAVLLERAYRRDKTHPTAGPLAVEALLAKGDFDRAEKIVMEMLDGRPLSRQATSLAMQLCRARKDAAAPPRLLEAYFNRGGKDLGFVLAMAEVAAELGEMDAAAKMLSQHVSSAPDSGRLVLRLARLYIRTGDLAAGTGQLARLLTMDVPESSQVHDEVQLLASKGAGKGFAEKLAASADQAGPKLRPALLTVAGMLAEAVDDRELATALLRRAVKADAKFWPAYQALDRLYLAEGDFEAFEELVRQAGAAASDSHFALYMAGKAHLRRGQVDEAVGKLEQASAKKEDHVPTLLLLARAYGLQGRPRDAQRRLLTALRAAPDNAEVVRSAFEFFIAHRRPAEADRLLKGFLRNNPESIPGRLMLGRYYFLTNNIALARKQLQSLLAEAPDDPEVALFQLQFELPQSLAGEPIPADRAEDAFRTLRRVLGKHPRNVPANRLYAALLVNQAKHLDAAKVLERLHRQVPYNVPVASAYLDALIQGKAEQQAADAIEKIAQADTVEPRMRLLLLDKLIQTKRYKPAASLAEKWLGASTEKTDKGELARLRLKALQVYEAAEDYDKAHALLDDWIASRPEAVMLELLRRQKLRVYTLARRYDDAVGYAEKWIRNEPKNRQIKALLLALLMDGKAYEKAHAVVDEWIRAGGDQDALRRLRASKLMLYGRQGKYEELLRSGEKWIAEDAEYQQANEVLIGVLAEHKQYDRALKVAEGWLGRQEKLAASAPEKAKALDRARSAVVEVLLLADRKRKALARAREFAEAAPKNVRILRLLYGALSAMAKQDESVALLEKMHKLDPDDAGINNDLGYGWADRGINLQEAEFMIRKALAEKPNQIAFKDSLAWVLYKQGRFSEAKTIFDEAVKADPEQLHAIILDHAADACWRLGLKAEAIRLWKQAVEMAKQEQREDPDTKKVLTDTPRKIKAARRGREPELAPLGQGVR